MEDEDLDAPALAQEQGDTVQDDVQSALAQMEGGEDVQERAPGERWMRDERGRFAAQYARGDQEGEAPGQDGTPPARAPDYWKPEFRRFRRTAAADAECDPDARGADSQVRKRRGAQAQGLGASRTGADGGLPRQRRNVDAGLSGESHRPASPTCPGECIISPRAPIGRTRFRNRRNHSNRNHSNRNHSRANANSARPRRRGDDFRRQQFSRKNPDALNKELLIISIRRRFSSCLLGGRSRDGSRSMADFRDLAIVGGGTFIWLNVYIWKLREMYNLMFRILNPQPLDPKLFREISINVGIGVVVIIAGTAVLVRTWKTGAWMRKEVASRQPSWR